MREEGVFSGWQSGQLTSLFIGKQSAYISLTSGLLQKTLRLLLAAALHARQNPPAEAGVTGGIYHHLI